MNNTQQLEIEALRRYVRQMTDPQGNANLGNIPSHMLPSIGVLANSKLTKNQLTAIINLMRSSYNLASAEKKI